LAIERRSAESVPRSSYDHITVSSRKTRGSASRKARPAPDECWADLADLVLEIAREIQFRGYASSEAVSLSPSEGTVMRHLLAHPESLPSEVAFATGLQRSNLSAVLRGLEEKRLVERVADLADGRWVRIHPTPRAIRNYELVRGEWGSALAAAAEADPAVEAAMPLLAKIKSGLVRLRQGGDSR
jgi:DNA-binding MarR family transcriptional regulator